MLELQKFLMEHPDDYEDILTQKPYCLKIKYDDNMVLFKYDQVNSDFHEPIVREARGIILENKTWKILRLAFYKFFNYGEELAPKNLNWVLASGTEKIDGSLMSVFWYNGHWRLASNGTIDAFKAMVSVFDAMGTLTDEKISFGEIFESVMPLSAFEDFNMDINVCYTFELTSPKTQVVIKYDKPGLHIISARYMNTLIEEYYPAKLLPDEMIEKYHIQIPQRVQCGNMDEYRKFVDEMGDDHEGIVVFDGIERVKMKTSEYLVRHYYKCNGVNLERLANVVTANEDSEFLSYFPEYEESVKKLHKYVDRLKKFADTCDGNLAVFDVDLFGIMNNIIDPKERRKQFASWVMEHFGNDPYKKGLLFKGYDKKAAETVKGWSQNKWVDFIKYAVEHPEEWGK